MASMVEQSYGSLFSQQQRHDDFDSYPEPPRNPFASASSMHLDIGMPCPTGTSVGFASSLCSETPSYILTSHTSPGVYADDIDLRLPSSGLSATSIPSAPSSIAGSPQSHHVQLGGGSDWISSSSSNYSNGNGNGNGNTMTLHPNIVEGDYMHGSEYFHHSGLDDYSSFDFSAQPKTFVGKFLKVFAIELHE
ncbi:hypothetical protein E4U21_003827 [Claviceps maximensis]|nr:hypothetical protein E4U21_003827 [Claviceps maximensis]